MFRANGSRDMSDSMRTASSRTTLIPGIDGILLGPGVGTKSLEHLRNQVAHTPVPVFLESYAAGSYPSAERNCFGVVGTMGATPGLNERLLRCKHLLCIGVTFRDSILPVLTSSGSQVLLTVVDYDSLELSRELETQTVDFFSFEDFDYQSVSFDNLAWTELDGELKAMTGEALRRTTDIVSTETILLAISESLAGTESLIWDSGTIDVFAPRSVQIRHSNLLARPFSQGAMGYALGGIVGSLALQPSTPVISIVGDGSLSMNSQELQTVAALAGQVKLFCIENGMYDIIRARQESLFRGRTIGTGVDNGVPQFLAANVAQAFGWETIMLSTLEDVRAAVSESIGPNAKILYSIKVDPLVEDRKSAGL